MKLITKQNALMAAVLGGAICFVAVCATRQDKGGPLNDLAVELQKTMLDAFNDVAASKLRIVEPIS